MVVSMRIALAPTNSIADEQFQSGIFGDETALTSVTQHVLIELMRDVINNVDRNEYKRQQAAPGLKVTTKAFGIGRRFPIAQRFYE